MLICKELLVVLIVLTATCCGQEPKPIMNNYRMTSGEEVTIKEYHYMASLQDFNLAASCSPVIIDKEWLLTTTLCITDNRGKVFKRHELHVMPASSSRLKCGNMHMRNVAYYYIQPGHTANDIYSLALIRISEPLEFGHIVEKIRLPTERGMALPKVGEQCLGIDYGLSNKTNTRVLKKIVVTIAPNSECGKLDFDFICTTHKNKADKNNCPTTRVVMVCKDTLVAFAVSATVGYKGCGDKDSFVAWLRVDSDLPWINTMVATTSKVTHKDVAPNATAASSGHDFTASLILVLAAAVLTVAK